MSHPSGRWLPLSLPRRFMSDLVSLAQYVPARTLERPMALRDVVDAREMAWPRPGWAAVFLKAYAIVADRRPHLRQMYMPLPWPHLYEHPVNVATVAVSRDFGDEEAVFFAPLTSPETLSLVELDCRLRQLREQPIETIRAYRRMLRVAALPLPLRRLVLWLGCNVAGRRAARNLGTFGLNTVAALGASAPDILSPWSTALHYDAFRSDGSVHVRLSYDHRVRDAATIARVLADLEDVLHGEIVNELRYLRAVEAA